MSHLDLAPLECLTLVITSDPGCEGKSCVRTCTYCFTCCLYVFTYYYTCCSMHCMRDPSRFLRYPYGPSGLLLVWTTLSSIHRCTTGTSQVQDRGQSAWAVGARVILELTDDICLYLLSCEHVVYIWICIDFVLADRCHVYERFVYCTLLSERHVVSFISTFSDVHFVDVLHFLITASARWFCTVIHWITCADAVAL